MAIYVLDPDAVDDYGQDWTPWLENSETIASQTATALDAGINVSDVTQLAGVVTYRVSNGTVGTNQRVVVHVVSSTGREDDRTDTFMVRDR